MTQPSQEPPSLVVLVVAAWADETAQTVRCHVGLCDLPEAPLALHAAAKLAGVHVPFDALRFYPTAAVEEGALARAAVRAAAPMVLEVALVDPLPAALIEAERGLAHHFLCLLRRLPVRLLALASVSLMRSQVASHARRTPPHSMRRAAGSGPGGSPD
jgi:hypothetical protein